MVDATIAASGALQGVLFGGSLSFGEPPTNLVGSPLIIDTVGGSVVFQDAAVGPDTLFDLRIQDTALDEFDHLPLTDLKILTE